MQILRGVLLTVGAALVFLAACATEWEPVPILLMGGSGLALCGICLLYTSPRRPARRRQR